MTLVATIIAALVAVHLGITLAVAGTTKVLAPATLSSVLFRDRLVPHRAIRPLVVVVPWLELVGGVWLLSGFAPKAAAAAACTMLMLFVLYGALRAITGRSSTGGCGCFGVWRKSERHLDALAGTTINTLVAAAQWKWLSVHISIGWQGSVLIALASVASLTWIAHRQITARPDASWRRTPVRSPG